MVLPKISIIVPTYNRNDALLGLLASLKEQTVAPDTFEVIIVDDGSATPCHLPQADYPFSVLLRRQANAGPAAARNEAIAHVRAPLTLIMNDDAIAAPDLIETHLTTHAQRHDSIAVLGQFPFAEHLLTSPFMRVLDASDLLFPHRYLTAGGLHGPGFFWTCNLSIPTQALREVGGFDAQRFRSAICEDIEIGHRLADIGYKVLYVPEAKCVHDHYISPDAYARRAIKLGTNTFILAQLHGWALLGLTEGETLASFYTSKREQYLTLQPKMAGLLQQINTIEASGTLESLEQANQLMDAAWWVNWTHYLGSMTEALGAYLERRQQRALRIA